MWSAAEALRHAVDRLSFADPVAHVYNPLDYAWDNHAAYLRRYGTGAKKVVFLGMNPGPFGMMQTGVPFGEIAAVRDWLGLHEPIQKPTREHPERPIEGWHCTRSEVSGRRLWGLFSARFGTASQFFAEHFVINYCPLAFLGDTGRNLTPDKLPAREAVPLQKICDEHLRAAVLALHPAWVVGIGAFATQRAQGALAGMPVQVGQALHPSPASPAANRDWAGVFTRQLIALGIWE